MSKNNIFLGVVILRCMVAVCVGIAERWSDSRIKYPKKGVRGGKKYNHAFFYDENGKFFTKRITKSEEIKLRLHGIWKKRKFVCQVCSGKFLGLIKHDKDIPECPFCK